MKVSKFSGLIVGLSVAGVAYAAPITSVETDIADGVGAAPGDPYTPTFASGGPSSSDLLHLATASASSGDFTVEASAGLPALTDGTFDTFYGDQTDASDHTAYATAGGGTGTGTTVTYDLASATDIAEIVIYGGWNDGGRDEQGYELFVSSDNGATYISLGTASSNPGIFGTTMTPASSRISFTDDSSATLAAGVTNIRVDFAATENGYTGYAEIDAFAVPEPGSLALLGLGGLMLARRRRAA